MTDITLEGSDVPRGEWPELTSVLSKLAAAHGPEPWGRPPLRIEVRRKLSGLGGAIVLDVVVHHLQQRTFVVVVKVDTAERASTEYHAFEKVVRPAASELCPPIVAATPGVLDPQLAHPREREAIVYQHVAEFVGEPAGALTTLEDVFERASLGDPAAARRAVAAVAWTFTRARKVFYGAPIVEHEASLREFAHTLGPDITVERGPGGRPVYWPEILAAGTGGPDGVRIGDRVTITGLTREDSGGVPIGRRDAATVEVRPSLPDVDPGQPFDLDGQIVGVRPETVMLRLGQAIDGLREGDDIIEAPGITAMHPYAALHPALLEDRLPTVRSWIHGDLNSRNVLLVDSPYGQTAHDRPYLIDYARAIERGCLLTDFVWLELNLMRACAGDPSLADIVRVQRTLTVAAATFGFGTDNDREPGAPVSPVHSGMTGLLAATAPGLAAIWPVLARLRWEAWRSYPRNVRKRWFADYNRHLIVAAHRTFKWPYAQQSPTRLAASTAVAAVGAEWRDPAAAFRHWPDSDLGALAKELPDALVPAGVEGAPLLGAVAAEIDRRRTADPARLDEDTIGDALTTAAMRLAAAAYRPSRPDPARRPFLDLSAEYVGPAGQTEELLSAVTVLTAEPFAALTGPPGSGKTTVATTIADRMLAALARREGGRHRLPVPIPARTLPGGSVAEVVARHAPIADASAARVVDLLRAGCLHLTIDGITGPADWPAALAWAEEVRRAYPRTTVLLCGRTLPGEGYRGLRRYRLLPPTAAMVVGYLTESAALGSLPVRHVRRVLAGAQVTAELLASPLLVSMLADHLAPHGRPPGVGAVLERYFASRPEVRTTDWDEACGAAAAFAAGGHPPEAADRALLVASGVLDESAAGLAFARPIYRDFFAATYLIRHPDLLPDRARQLDWQEPLRLAVSRSDRPGILLATALPIVWHTDPVFAGRLIEAAEPSADDATVQAFVAEQVRTLHDESAGEEAWERAATALATLRTHGIQPLRRSICDRTRPEGARLAGLAVLAGTVPANLLRALLGDRLQPAALRAAAARLAADRGATHLAVLIADGCDPSAQWVYRHAAHAALDQLGVALPTAMKEAYRSAAADRLTELDRLLPTMTTTSGADAAQDEQRELLRGPLAGDLDTLLAHRFTFDLADDVADILNRPDRPQPPDGAGDALNRFSAAADKRSAAAAADELLRTAPHRAADLVRSVRPDDPPFRLRAAAVAANRQPDCRPHLEMLARALLARPRPPAEALAALIVAVSHLDPIHGGRLAEDASVALHTDPARLHWPLRTAIARAMPSRELWDRLLAEDAALGVAALSAPGFHLDGARPDEHRLAPDALHALVAAAPAAAPTWAAVDFIRAAATVRLTDALPLVGDLLDLEMPEAMIREVTYRGYGILALAWPSEVLSAGGFLAGSAPAGDRAAAAVNRRIRDLDTANRHPSVAAGRLIALSYLGDPGPLLSRLDTAEPRLHAAACHTVLDLAARGAHGPDSPHGPQEWRDPVQAMDEVADLHASARTAQARTTLQSILDELSRRTGRLPAPPAAPMGPCG